MEMTNEKEKKEKEPLTTKQKVFLGLRIVGNVFFYSILICLLIFSIMNINGGDRNKNFPNIFGRGFLNVTSNSMERDSSTKESWPEEWDDYKIKGIKKGDLVNVKVFKKSQASKIKIGDVITFYDGNLKALNTHRVVDYMYKDNKVVGYVCQGDYPVSIDDSVYYTYDKYCEKFLHTEAKYNEDGSPDTNSVEYKDWSQAMYMITSSDPEQVNIQFVDVKSVKGVVYSVKPGGGKTLDWMTDHWLLIFIFPVLIVLVFEIFLVIRNILVLRGEKNIEALDNRKEEIIAEEKEKMRLELLAEMYGGIDNIPEEMRNPKKANSEEPKQEENKEVIESNEEKSEDSVTEDNKETELAHEEVNNEANAIVEEETKEDLDKPEVESEDVKPQDDNKEE